MKFKEYIFDDIEFVSEEEYDALDCEEVVVESEGDKDPTKAVKKIKITNTGKKVVKWKCPAEGFDKDPSNEKRCIKVKMNVLRKRAKASKKRAKKMKAKMGKILAKRAKALKKRDARGM